MDGCSLHSRVFNCVGPGAAYVAGGVHTVLHGCWNVRELIHCSGLFIPHRQPLWAHHKPLLRAHRALRHRAPQSQGYSLVKYDYGRKLCHIHVSERIVELILNITGGWSHTLHKDIVAWIKQFNPF